MFGTLRFRLAAAFAAIAALSACVVGIASFQITSWVIMSQVDTSIHTALRALPALDVRRFNTTRADADADIPTSRELFTSNGRPIPRLPNSSQPHFHFDDAPAPTDTNGGTSRRQHLGRLGILFHIATANGTALVSDYPQHLQEEFAKLRPPPRQTVSALRTVTHGDNRFRFVSLPIRGGYVIIGRSLAEVDTILAALTKQIIGLSAGVTILAALLGTFFAHTLTRRLRTLTSTAQHVTDTGNLNVVINTTKTGDEVGRLTTAFNQMITRLATSKAEQDRLVQDAGHELRTPLTSLRANIDALTRYPNMPTGDRRELLADLTSEVSELTSLVDEVVAVASGDTSAAVGNGARTTVTLEEAAAPVLEKMRRRTNRTLTLRSHHNTNATDRPSELSQPYVSIDVPAVQRALSCLIENALKFDPSDTPVIIDATANGLWVEDAGPGIDPADLTNIFKRFHRSPEARTLPGSGLGLSIVAQVAAAHGGKATATNLPDGGARIGFTVTPEPLT